MKMKLLLATAVFLYVLPITIHAQGTSVQPLPQMISWPDISKGISSGEMKGISLNELKYINVRVHRDFLRHFKNASNIIVADKERNTFIYCTINGIRTRIDYTNKGSWLNTFKYLSPKQLQAHLFQEILKNYPYYKIVSAVEVTTLNKKALLVNIQNEHSTRIIRISDNDWSTLYQW